MRSPNEELIAEFEELWINIKKEFFGSTWEDIERKMAIDLSKSSAKARGEKSKSSIAYILYDAAEKAYLKGGYTPKTRKEITNIVSKDRSDLLLFLNNYSDIDALEWTDRQQNYEKFC